MVNNIPVGLLPIAKIYESESDLTQPVSTSSSISNKYSLTVKLSGSDVAMMVIILTIFVAIIFMDIFSVSTAAEIKTIAQLSHGAQPNGVAFPFISDATNFILISASGHHCIYKVSLDDFVVSNFAGKCGTRGHHDGFGTYARFDTPTSIAADIDGSNYYVSDANNVIKRIVTHNSFVTTIIGATQVIG